MASRAEIDKTLKRLGGFYPNGIPASVLADTLKVSEKEAASLIAEYGTPPKPKRVYKKKPKVEEVKPKKEFDFTIFIRWLMLIVAIPAIVLSGYFSIDALGASLPFGVALTMGIVLCGFAVLTFEATILFKRDKNLMWIATGAMWLILMVFSATSIVTSLYNNYVSREETKEKQEVIVDKDYTLYKGYEDKIKEAETAKIVTNSKIKSEQAILDELNTIEKQKINQQRYNTALVRISVGQKEIKAQQDIIDEATASKNVLLQNNPELLLLNIEKRQTAFAWLATIFNTTEGLVQFYIQTIPALALDLIGSLALYVFFFPKKKKEEYDKKLKN